MISAKEAYTMAEEASKDYEVKLVKNFREDLERSILHAAVNGLFEVLVQIPINIRSSTNNQIVVSLGRKGYTVSSVNGWLTISWRNA